MQIIVRGKGPALVMIHGWAMHAGVFAPLVAKLEKNFTLYLVDLPGHGHSRASTLPLELDVVAQHIARNTPRALWLGWSLGGLVALHAAQTFPNAVRGLIMLCASPCFVRNAAWPLGMDAAVFNGFAHGLASDYRGTLDRFLMLEAQGSDHVREELRLLREQIFAFGEPLQNMLYEGLTLLQNSDLRLGLATLASPSLWLAGRRDRLVSPQAMQAAAALTPHSHFVQIESGGHAPFLTHAAEVAQAIETFASDLAL